MRECFLFQQLTFLMMDISMCRGKANDGKILENHTIGRIIRLMSENARAKETFLDRSSLPSKFSMSMPRSSMLACNPALKVQRRVRA